MRYLIQQLAALVCWAILALLVMVATYSALRPTPTLRPDARQGVPGHMTGPSLHDALKGWNEPAERGARRLNPTSPDPFFPEEQSHGNAQDSFARPGLHEVPFTMLAMWEGGLHPLARRSDRLL